MPRIKLTTEEKKARRRAILKKYHQSTSYKASRKKYNESAKGKAKIKEYRKTLNGKKNNRLKHWRKRGLIDADNDNYAYLYREFLMTSNCMICGVKFEENTHSMKRRCLDHDHSTGLYRCVCCAACNVSLA